MTDDLPNLAEQYDESYYEHHLGQPYRRGDRGWEGIFGRVAGAIVAELAPESVLDAGCAIGFLVEALRDQGVDAYGFDISEYAISQVPEELRDYCWVGSITDPLERSYDLTVCIEVLEHLPPELAETAIANLAGHSSRILFSSTPSDYAEPTHLNVQPMEYWVGLFARHGFFRDVDFDASFIAPHAIYFRSSHATAASVARGYERWHWRHREEVVQLRAAAAEQERELDLVRRQVLDAVARADRLDVELVDTRARADHLDVELVDERARADRAEERLAEWDMFRQRSGVRMFLKLASVRERLAPPASRRDAIVRTALARIADTIDRSSSRAAAPDAQLAVVFVSGCPGDAMRYRCTHQAEQLRLLGATVEVAQHGQIDLLEAVDRYRFFVLHRVPWGPDVDAFLQAARRRRRPVIFDTDDLVFDPEATTHVAALEDMDEASKRLFVSGLTRYRRTLRESDAVIVSTDALRGFAETAHDRTFVAYNAVGDEMVHLAEAAVRRQERQARGAAAGDAVTIAYMSGTPTHNRDFLEAADAILWALEEMPQTRFLAVGHLALDERFERYGDRVERVPLQPWQRLPELLARTDINIAPLEPHNPFTDSKSCLKYIEAGLVGVPTVASPRPDFVRAICSGENGMLADSVWEWQEALSSLIASADLRSRLGAAAAADVMKNHTVNARSRDLYGTVAELGRFNAQTEPLTINWVLRAPIAERGGGYRTIFRLANALGARGHRVRVYVEAVAHLHGLSDREIHEFIAEHFGPLHVEVVVGLDDIDAADATVATNWPTAPVVAAHQRSLFKLYLIQDIESEFYAAGSPESHEAEATYGLPLRYVCYGRFLAGEMTRRTGRPADALDFALEPAFRTTIDPAKRGGPPAVLFFARPDQKRRGFEIGIEALRAIARERPDTEIRFFGARDDELPEIDFPFVNLGVLSVDELAEALNAAHVFLGFSLTNISHAPLEAMACGCAVVEADVPSVREMVAPEACVLVAPDPGAVAAAVVALLADAERRVRLARNGRDAVSGSSWDQTAGQLETLLTEMCFVRLGDRQG